MIFIQMAVKLAWCDLDCRNSGQSRGSRDDELAAASVEEASPTTVGKAREELSTDFI
jgi:hypothetical protein